MYEPTWRCLAAIPGGQPVVVNAATNPPQECKVFAVLSHFCADTPAHATVACAMGVAAEKGCSRCGLCTYKSKVVEAPDGSDQETTTVSLPSNPYAGYSSPAITQTWALKETPNGPAWGQADPSSVQFSKRVNGHVKLDREAVTGITLGEDAHRARANVAEWVIEEEMAGFKSEARNILGLSDDAPFPKEAPPHDQAESVHLSLSADDHEHLACNCSQPGEMRMWQWLAGVSKAFDRAEAAIKRRLKVVGANGKSEFLSLRTTKCALR